MFRPMASSVSALWGFVANGRQVMHSFPLPPLKFRTAGFPQYGLKPHCPAATFVGHGRPRRLISGQSARRCAPGSPCGQSVPLDSKRGVCTSYCGPEALGSPAGCSVPPGHRLLWPHPSLVRRIHRLICFVRQTLGAAEGPSFILPVCASVPLALPRRTRWLLAISWPPVLPSTIFERLGVHNVRAKDGSRPVRLTRLHNSLYAAARKLARPPPPRAFTFELSSHESPRWNVKYDYAGNSRFPRPDFHRQDKQPCWLHRRQTRRK
jgi:hypothetical protein